MILECMDDILHTFKWLKTSFTTTICCSLIPSMAFSINHSSSSFLLFCNSFSVHMNSAHSCWNYTNVLTWTAITSFCLTSASCCLTWFNSASFSTCLSFRDTFSFCEGDTLYEVLGVTCTLYKILGATCILYKVLGVTCTLYNNSSLWYLPIIPQLSSTWYSIRSLHLLLLLASPHLPSTEPVT